MSYTTEKFLDEVRIAKSLLQNGNKLIIDDYVDSIAAITETFVQQGHSGGSAPMMIKALTTAIEKALKQKPLSPLNGTEDEWNNPIQLAEGDLYQNKRQANVLKVGVDGDPYCTDAIVWKGEEEWDVFLGVVEGYSSRQYLRLPAEAETFYINVRKELYDEDKHDESEVVQHGDAKYVYKIVDKSELNKLSHIYWINGLPKPVEKE
jgi:hypothetical protein